MQAKPFMESGNLAQLADPKLIGKYDLEELHTLVLTASYCIRQSSIWRPSMSEVSDFCFYFYFLFLFFNFYKVILKTIFLFYNVDMTASTNP
jgi:hypothetical protein